MERSDINITSLLNLSDNKAICTLFKFQELNILFDCGWDEEFSDEIANIYKEYFFILIK